MTTTNNTNGTIEMYGVEFPVRVIRNVEIIENEIPTLKIVFDNENGCYLQPFRKYCFQVSGTIDGDGNYGSSAIIHYTNLTDLPVSVRTAILTDAAKSAIKDFETRNPWVAGDVALPRYIFAKFIDECHRWIYNCPSDYIV